MKLITTLLSAILCVSAQAATLLGTGTLTSGDGLNGTGTWQEGVTFEWDVREIPQQDGRTAWHYAYKLSVSGQDISHVVVQTCPEADLQTNGYDLGAWSPHPSSPNTPAMTWGAKFEPNTNLTEYSFNLTSWTAPEWGQVYAKSGYAPAWTGDTWTTMWSDTNSVPVPGCATHLPEPSSVMLLGLGALTVFKRRR